MGPRRLWPSRSQFKSCCGGWARRFPAPSPTGSRAARDVWSRGSVARRAVMMRSAATPLSLDIGGAGVLIGFGLSRAARFNLCCRRSQGWSAPIGGE